MGKWFEAHKHTTHSLFDGFGDVHHIVARAVELGFKALAITDHGTASGVADLYLNCMKVGIKPILGMEAYFRPNMPTNSERDRFHMCVYAKNWTGYQNLMRMLTQAETKDFYYKGLVTMANTTKHKEGLMVTSGCVAGYIPQAILKGEMAKAKKMAEWFKQTFGDDFYLEIMPFSVFMREQDFGKYKVPNKYDEDIQWYVNDKLIQLSKMLNIKCIITTDSHYTAKEDWPSYHMMHKLNKTKYDISAVYEGRYMHSESEIINRMKRSGMTKAFTMQCLDNMEEMQAKVVEDIFEGEKFHDSIPNYDSGLKTSNTDLLLGMCKDKLKETGRYNKKYCTRVKTEHKVLKAQGIEDYFLIVADYVKYAKSINCYMGPGRGSVCGSSIAELMGITDVDPIEVGTYFERFLRADKKKMPDIDLDFESGKRQEVIDYILEKYKGRSAQVMTFGFYKTAYLVSDLIKNVGMEDVYADMFKRNIKKLVKDKGNFDIQEVNLEVLMNNIELRTVNNHYQDEYGVGPVEHFAKIYGTIRYRSKHAAGVVITNGPIEQWVGLHRTKDGGFATCFDKYGIEGLYMMKFDILALKTLSMLHDVEVETGDKFIRSKVSKERMAKVYKAFKERMTTGVFQSGSKTAKDIYEIIMTNSIQDIIAAISLNRPGPLKMQMHQMYAGNKLEPDKSTVWYKYTSDAFGTIIYQEHVMNICRSLAHMNNDDIDMLMKRKFDTEEKAVLRKTFVDGCIKYSGMVRSVAEALFDAMTLYLFNKAHATGYAFISEWAMYHKVYHPIEYYFATLKYEEKLDKQWDLKREAVKHGCVIFLAHVNYSPQYSIRSEDGDKIIQEGTMCIKNVGVKAADQIEHERKNGPFTSKKDFIDRCQHGPVNVGVIKALDEYGALEFNKKRYISRVIKFNSSLYR